MSRLAQALGQKDFVISVELDPPRGVDLGPWLETAKALTGRVDALVVSDNRGAVPRQSPLLAAHRLAAELKGEVVLTLTCRDRNRLALTSELLAAAAAGIGNILLVSGDYPSLGDHPQSKPVYDLDSVQALGLAKGLMAGRDLSGAELAGSPTFFLGAALAAAAQPLAPQLIKFRKKVKAGAGFFITNPLVEVAPLEALLKETGQAAPPILAGVEVGDPAGRQAAVEMVKALKGAKLVKGVHLSQPGDQAGLSALLDACGL